MGEKALFIIDDSEVMLSLLQEMITSLDNFTVSGTSSTGVDAPDKIQQLDSVPDLMLVDLVLPDIDGVALIEDLRKRFPSAILLIMSAITDETIIKKALDAGASDNITKPFTMKELEKKLGQLLG